MRNTRCLLLSVGVFTVSTIALYVLSGQVPSLPLVLEGIPYTSTGARRSDVAGDNGDANNDDLNEYDVAVTGGDRCAALAQHGDDTTGDDGRGKRTWRTSATPLTLFRVERILVPAVHHEAARLNPLALWERALSSTAEGRRVVARVKAWSMEEPTPSSGRSEVPPLNQGRRRDQPALLRPGWTVRVVAEEAALPLPSSTQHNSTTPVVCASVAVITIPREDVVAVDLQQLFYALLLAERGLHEASMEDHPRQHCRRGDGGPGVLATGVLFLRRTTLEDDTVAAHRDAPSSHTSNNSIGGAATTMARQRVSDVLNRALAYAMQTRLRQGDSGKCTADPPAAAANDSRVPIDAMADGSNGRENAALSSRLHRNKEDNGLRRVMIGQDMVSTTPQGSCHIANQGGMLGAGTNSPFQVNEVAPTFPLFVSRDIVQYVVEFFAKDVIGVLAELEHSLPPEMRAPARPPSAAPAAGSQLQEEEDAAAGSAQNGPREQAISSASREGPQGGPTPAEEAHASSTAQHLDPIESDGSTVPPGDAPTVPLHPSPLEQQPPSRQRQREHKYASATLVRRSPVVAACGVPLRLKQLAPGRFFNMPPIPIKDCLVLMLSGRDVHKATWAEWETKWTDAPTAVRDDASTSCNTTSAGWMKALAATSHRSLLSREQMPYVWMAQDASHGQTATQELASGGLPWRDDDDEGGDAMRFVPAVSVDLHVGDGVAAAVDVPPDVAGGETGHSVLAAVYVPTRIDQFRMRDMIRCYHRSLDVGVRARLPLHFLLGARATMDSRFVFRGRGSAVPASYQDPRNGASVWHRLLAENCSTDFERRSVDAAVTTAGGGGDLLLLDVIDLDRAPYTTESPSERAKGVHRAMETLRAPPSPRHAAKSWHHNSEISAMLIKLLVGMVHMVRMYPTSHFFVRGADDAYVSFQRVYLDALQAVRRYNRRKQTTHAGISRVLLKPVRTFLGHVTQNAILLRCGRSEIAASGILSSSGAVATERVAAAPAVYPEYVTGGGSVMSRDVAAWIAASVAVAAPHLWVEEDVALGRLAAPVVLPKKSFQFHNFFNATKDVDWAFHGRVPRAYRYCDPSSWVVHKYPPSARGALRFVDATSMAMYCNEGDFALAAGGGRAPAAHDAVDDLSGISRMAVERRRVVADVVAPHSAAPHYCWGALRHRFAPTSTANTSAGELLHTSGDGWPTWFVEEKYLKNVRVSSFRRNRDAKTFGSAKDLWQQAYARRACDPEAIASFLEYVPQVQCET